MAEKIFSKVDKIHVFFEIRENRDFARLKARKLWIGLELFFEG